MKEYPSFEIPQEIWREKIVAFTSHAEGQRAVPILLLAVLKGRWTQKLTAANVVAEVGRLLLRCWDELRARRQ